MSNCDAFISIHSKFGLLIIKLCSVTYNIALFRKKGNAGSVSDIFLNVLALISCNILRVTLKPYKVPSHVPPPLQQKKTIL